MRKLVFTLCAFLLFAAAVTQAQISSTFFGMGVSVTADPPKVNYGTLSHPAVAWTSIEGKGRGTYTFGAVDGFVKIAPKDANGVALLALTMGWTPGWAVADQTTCFHNKNGITSCTAPPDNIQDWIDFITAVVNHYNGITAPHIKYYEIWNEMSNTKFWTGTPEQMVALAQAAYPIIKQDPYAVVSTPSVVWVSGKNYMPKYLQAGGYQYADVLSFHGYPSQTGGGATVPVPMPEDPLSTNAPIMTMLSTFRGIADTNGMLNKPIVTTEGGWGTNGVSDPDMQAAWITHYEILQAALASTNNLQFQTWYTWGEVPSGTIENKDGTPTAAGLAYNVVLTWLLGFNPAPCSVSGNIYTCQVAFGKQVVWDTSQTCSSGSCTTAPYTVDPAYTKYQDITGLKAPIVAGTVKLGIKPLLLVK
ncbi:MAG TPA: hypothetical protein VI386_27265 [Candidatus Sulfotelmatobacter sp.]